MLVIHGQLDYRVPYAQGLAVFTALQRRGVPSEFLYFPDENHWVLKPANSIQWYDTVDRLDESLDRPLKGSAGFERARAGPGPRAPQGANAPQVSTPRHAAG